jgi:hypothetical protein
MAQISTHFLVSEKPIARVLPAFLGVASKFNFGNSVIWDRLPTKQSPNFTNRKQQSRRRNGRTPNPLRSEYRVCFTGLTRPGYGLDHLHSSSAQFKNEWSYISTLLHDVLQRCIYVPAVIPYPLQTFHAYRQQFVTLI